MKIDKETLYYIIDKAREKGADYAEARFHSNKSSTILLRNGNIIGVGMDVTEGVGIRVLVSGSLAFSATNNLDKESLERTLDKAISAARAGSHYNKKPILFSNEKMEKASYSVEVKKDPKERSFEEKIGYLKELWKQVSSSTNKAKVQALFTMYSETIEEKSYVNTEGAEIESHVPRIKLFYNIAVQGTNGEGANRWYEYAASGGLELLEEWNVEEVIVEEARILEKVLEEAKRVPQGKYDVVLGTEVVGLMVHESCGHPTEADRILGREAAQAGESFITKEMIHTRIGSEHVTVIDDPTIPRSNGYYLFDDEGVKARPRYLYNEGIINEFLNNRATAAELNVKSNAAARAMDYNSEPIVRMANTYFKPGEYTLEELIEDVKDGLYVKSYMEWNIDDKRWGQRYVGLEAYRIEHGKITYMVKNPILEFTTKEVYTNTDAVGKNLEFHAGVCGKGEPGQGVPVWFGGPEIRVRKMRMK